MIQEINVPYLDNEIISSYNKNYHNVLKHMIKDSSKYCILAETNKYTSMPVIVFMSMFEELICNTKKFGYLINRPFELRTYLLNMLGSEDVFMPTYDINNGIIVFYNNKLIVTDVPAIDCFIFVNKYTNIITIIKDLEYTHVDSIQLTVKYKPFTLTTDSIFQLNLLSTNKDITMGSEVKLKHVSELIRNYEVELALLHRKEKLLNNPDITILGNLLTWKVGQIYLNIPKDFISICDDEAKNRLEDWVKNCGMKISLGDITMTWDLEGKVFLFDSDLRKDKAHPHSYSNKTICLGTYTDLITQALDREDYEAMFAILKNMLSNAKHSDTFGRTWIEWVKEWELPSSCRHCNKTYTYNKFFNITICKKCENRLPLCDECNTKTVLKEYLIYENIHINLCSSCVELPHKCYHSGEDTNNIVNINGNLVFMKNEYVDEYTCSNCGSMYLYLNGDDLCEECQIDHCEYCNGTDEVEYVEDLDRLVCYDCRSERYCQECESYKHIDDIEDGLCSDCSTRCSDCEERFPNDECLYYNVLDKYLCEECLKEYRCSNCDEIGNLDDDGLCDNCAKCSVCGAEHCKDNMNLDEDDEWICIDCKDELTKTYKKNESAEDIAARTPMNEEEVEQMRRDLSAVFQRTPTALSNIITTRYR